MCISDKCSEAISFFTTELQWSWTKIPRARRKPDYTSISGKVVKVRDWAGRPLSHKKVVHGSHCTSFPQSQRIKCYNNQPRNIHSMFYKTVSLFSRMFWRYLGWVTIILSTTTPGISDYIRNFSNILNNYLEAVLMWKWFWVWNSTFTWFIPSVLMQHSRRWPRAC